MRTLDWIVLVTSLVSIVAYGLYRSRGSNTVDRYLLAGQIHAVVRHGALHHGHPGQRHHLHLHHRPILRGRHALRAVLFRTAARHGGDLRHRGADFPPHQGLHRVRIPGEALRRQDPRPGQHHFPLPARAFRGADDLRAGAGALGDPGMAGAHHHLADGRGRGHLHGARRHQGGHLVGRAADVRHLPRA